MRTLCLYVDEKAVGLGREEEEVWQAPEEESGQGTSGRTRFAMSVPRIESKRETVRRMAFPLTYSM